MKNRIKFWLRPPSEMPLDEAYAAADGESINKATQGLIVALASSEGTEFLFKSEPVPPCPPYRDARQYLARELRGLALRCTLAAQRLEGRESQ